MLCSIIKCIEHGVSVLCKNCGIETGSANKMYCCNNCIQVDRRKCLLQKIDKLCPRCNKLLPIGEFITGSIKRPYRSYCKSCNRLWEKERKSKLSPKEKETRLLIRRNYQYVNYETFFRSSLTTIKSRAKRKNIFFDLTVKDLIDIAEKQHFNCALSGIALEFKANSDKHVLASIDRIIPSLGYTKSNIQLLTFQVNWMKNDLSTEELYKTCKNIIEWLNHESSK